MKIKRSLATVLAGAVVLSSLSLGVSAANYPDVKDSYWAKSSIDRWSGYGVVKGDTRGQFNPEQAMKRGELATMLADMLGLKEAAQNTFHDVPDGKWYAEPILKCAAAGIMQGDTRGNANPESPISRQEAAVMLGRALGIEPAQGTPSFSDGVEDWAAGYVKALADKGIVNGVSEGVFGAETAINRASVATILDRAVATYSNQAGETVEAKAGGITLIAAPDVVVTGEVADMLVAPGASEGKVTLQDAKVSGKVQVDAPKAELALEGKTEVADVVVTADAAKVAVGAEAKADSIAVEAKDAALEVSGEVKSVEVAKEAEGAAITANKDAKITTVTTEAKGTEVKGEGKVETVKTTDKADTKVETKGTKVEQVNTDSGKTEDKKPSGGNSSGGGGSSDDGPSTTTVSGIVKAPMVDRADTSKPESELADSYSVSATKTSNRDYTDITISATNVKLHQNGVGNNGYWVGFGIEETDAHKGTGAKVAYAADSFANAEGKLTSNNGFDSSFVKDGKTYNTFYVNAANYKTAYFVIEWPTVSDATPVKERYLVNLNGVTLFKETAPGFANATLTEQEIITKATGFKEAFYNQYVTDASKENNSTKAQTDFSTPENQALWFFDFAAEANLTDDFISKVTAVEINGAELNSSATIQTSIGKNVKVKAKAYDVVATGLRIAMPEITLTQPVDNKLSVTIKATGYADTKFDITVPAMKPFTNCEITANSNIGIVVEKNNKTFNVKLEKAINKNAWQHMLSLSFTADNLDSDTVYLTKKDENGLVGYGFTAAESNGVLGYFPPMSTETEYHISYDVSTADRYGAYPITLNVSKNPTVATNSESLKTALDSATVDKIEVNSDISLNADAELKAGKTLVVADGKTLTIAANATLTVAEGATLKGTVKGTADTSKLIVVGTVGELHTDSYVWNNDQWIKESEARVRKALESAAAYTYEDEFSRTGTLTVNGLGATYSASATAFQKPAQGEGEGITQATADLARFLGALHYFDNGETVTSITFDGTTYTWNAEIGLKGSKWGNAGTTLVSAVVTNVANQLSAPPNPVSLTFKVNEVETTVSISMQA